MIGKNKKTISKNVKALNCLIIMLLGNFLCAQTTFTGTVIGLDKNPLAGISVIANVKNSKEIIAYTYTDDNGIFSISLGNYQIVELIFNGLSYQEKTLLVNLKGNKEEDFQIILEHEETVLDEVFLESERAITVKKDTTVFNVDDF